MKSSTSKSEDRRPRVIVSGTSGYVDVRRMHRKLDQILANLKDPIVCTRGWWMHERKQAKGWQNSHLGAEHAGEDWAYQRKHLLKVFHPHEGKSGRVGSVEEMIAYCTARRPCFAVFYGVDESCRDLLKLCKRNDFVVRIVEAK